MLYELIIGPIRDVVCFHLGLVFLQLMTFGKYPSRPVPETARIKIEVLGLFILSALLILTWYLLRAYL